MNEITGNFIGCNGKYAIVAGRFNDFITSRLIDGAKDALMRHGVKADDIDCYWVPGAFEIPQVAAKALATGQYKGIITLGAVIRGATAHFDFVAGHCASGIAKLNEQTDVPVIFGVLTVDTIEQAIERAGTKAGNKGAEAAIAALEMADLLNKI